MTTADLRPIAHDALVLTPLPHLRYQKCGRFDRVEGVALTAQDVPGPSFNFATALGSVPPLDRVLAIADAFFAGKEGGYGVLVEGDAGHPIEAELKARSWTVFEDEPALVLPNIPPAAPLPPGFQVRRVVDEAGRRDFLAVCAEAFGTPAEMMEQLGPSLACMTAPDIASFVGFCDDQAVATVAVHRSGLTAIVSGVATLPSHRRRGFGTAITAVGLQSGAALGCTNAALRSGPMSLALYQRMGFLRVCQHRTYAPPGTAPVV
jgi:GNAT superfamily N-acetyltransferase